MKIEDLTDQRLQELGLVDELCKRFGGKEFCVYRRYASGVADYVEAIDAQTGEIDWTSDTRQARIFRGQEWVRVFAGKQFNLIVPDGLPRAQP